MFESDNVFDRSEVLALLRSARALQSLVSDLVAEAENGSLSGSAALLSLGAGNDVDRALGELDDALTPFPAEDCC